MDFQKLLQGRADCDCGMKHTCDIKYVEIGQNVLPKLAEICKDFKNITLVADENTYPLCGDTVAKVLGNKIKNAKLFSKEIVVPNEVAISAIEEKMTKDTDLLVGIGSGVIQDLCKYVSYFHNIRYVIVATAPSMDGYASVGAAMILKQMKVTVSARVPYAIVADSDVVKTAPMKMIQSGYGDIVGKYSCLNDWKLSHLIHGEYFCQYVYDVVMDTVKKTETTAKALLARDPDAIGNLMEGLVMVGIMMAYVGNSRPASGSEHHLAHFFEITGLLNHHGCYLHGIDVLYGAAITAQLRSAVLQKKPPFALCVQERSKWEEEIRRVYTTAADEVIALQDKVGNYAKLDAKQFEEKWKDITAVLSEAPNYEQMKGYVDAIGLDMEEFHTFYGDRILRDAVTYAKDLKDRYTVLWLAYALGV